MHQFHGFAKLIYLRKRGFRQTTPRIKFVAGSFAFMCSVFAIVSSDVSRRNSLHSLYGGRPLLSLLLAWMILPTQSLICKMHETRCGDTC